jgi:hypothetical protein
MALHLARSDRGKRGREKGDDQMMFSIILIRIIDQSVMGRRKSKIKDLTTHKLYLLCSFSVSDGEKQVKEKGDNDPFQYNSSLHHSLLSLS